MGKAQENLPDVRYQRNSVRSDDLRHGISERAGLNTPSVQIRVPIYVKINKRRNYRRLIKIAIEVLRRRSDFNRIFYFHGDLLAHSVRKVGKNKYVIIFYFRLKNDEPF